MKTKEIQKRNGKAQNLRVLQTEDEQYYVESAEGKILYRCVVTDNEVMCTCGDFVRNIKSDPNFRCKHLLAIENCASTGEYENGQFLDKIKPRLDDRFIINIKGKDFILFNGLLDLGHQKGIQSLRVEAVQFPTKENDMEAISKATLESKLGEIYEELGHATPKNVNYMVGEHLIHMSATRAKARALRDFTNAGYTALEELGSFDDVIGDEKGNAKTKPKPARKTAPRKTQKQNTPAPAQTKPENTKLNNPENKVDDKQNKNTKSSKKDKDNSDAPSMSEAQHRALKNLSRRRGISVDELENMCDEAYGVKLEHLSVAEASSFIRQLQTAA